MIQWFSKNEKTMIATISTTNITINKPGLDKINDAYAAMVGYDQDENKIALKPLSKDDYDRNVYPHDCLFVLSGGKTYTRISSTEFVASVSSASGISFSTAKKYQCLYNSQDKLLWIDLKKEVK